MERNPRNSLEHLNLGFTYQHLERFAEADSAYRTAIDLNAEQLHAWRLGSEVILELEGLDAARRRLREAPADVAVDPWLMFQQATFDQWAGDHGSALRLLALLDDEIASSDDVVATGISRALSHRALADTVRATAELDRVASLLESRLAENPEHPGVASQLGIAYAMLGRADDGIAQAERGARLMPVERDAIAGNGRATDLAAAYAWAGEHEKAISVLHGLLERPSLLTSNKLALDPIWTPLRGLPEFQALLDRAPGPR